MRCSGISEKCNDASMSFDFLDTSSLRWTPKTPPPLLPTFEISTLSARPVKFSQRSDLTRARDGTESLDVYLRHLKPRSGPNPPGLTLSVYLLETKESREDCVVALQPLPPKFLPSTPLSQQHSLPENLHLQLAQRIAFYSKIPVQKQRRMCLDKFVPPYNPYSERRFTKFDLENPSDGERDIPTRLAKHELGIKICSVDDFVDNVAVHLAKTWPADVRAKILKERLEKRGPSILFIARKLVREAYQRGYVPTKIPPPFLSGGEGGKRKKQRRCKDEDEGYTD